MLLLKKKRLRRDEEEARQTFELDEEISSDDESHDEAPPAPREETVEETRLRLAQEYLDQTRRETDDVAEKLEQDRTQTTLVASDLDSWDPQPRVFKGHRGPVTCCATTDTHLVSGSKDNSVLLFDIEAGKSLRLVDRWPHPAPADVEKARGEARRQSHQTEVLCVAARGDLCAVGGRDSLIHVLDWRQKSVAYSLRGHRGAVTGLAFGDEELFSTGDDGTMKHWRDRAHLETLFGHESAVRSLDLLDDRPLTGGADATLRSWKIRDETHLVYRARPGASVDACFLLSRDVFASASDDGVLALWSARRKKPVATVATAHGGQPPNWLTAVGGPRHTDLLVSGSCDQTLRLWRANEDSLAPVAQVPVRGFVNAVTATPDRANLVVATAHEHRLGRWSRVAKATNAVLLFPLGIAHLRPGDAAASMQRDEDDALVPDDAAARRPRGAAASVDLAAAPYDDPFFARPT